MKRRNLFIGILIVAFVLSFNTGVFAGTKTVKPSVPVIKSIESMDKAYVKVKWGRVSNAQGYQVYRLDSQENSFKKIATTKSTTIKDKGVVLNRKYSYKVRAYTKVAGKTKHSKFSAAEEIVFEDTFQKLLDEADRTHTEMNTKNDSFENLNNYAVSDTSTANLLSDSEIESLLQEREPKTVNKQEAKADINLYFRTMKSSYAAYYYFGADNFEKAEKNLISWIDKQQGVINPERLCKQIDKELSFVQDAHFSASNTWYNSINDRFYYYYYSYKNVFTKEGNKYTVRINGKKYTFKSFNKKDVELKKTLVEDGRIVYTPAILCREKQLPNCTMTVTDNAGRSKKIKIEWKKSKPYSEDTSGQDYHYLEETGVSYVSIRSFDSKLDSDIFRQFEESSLKMKNSDLIIFDIRANNGGNDAYGRKWIENFSGQSPVINAAYARRNSKLSSRIFGGGGDFGVYSTSRVQGKTIPNDIPIIVLVDNRCASSGESMLNFLRCLDNVVIIGSNSAGYQLSGNVHSLYLPNTGIQMAATMGALNFNYSTEPVDYKGYEPDIWCNPKDALDAVFNMVKRNAIADKKTIEALKSATDENTNPITLKFDKYTIREDFVFGANFSKDEIPVYYGDKKIEDYTFEYEKNGVCVCTRTDGGNLKVKVAGKGKCKITIKYKGKTASFIWEAKTDPIVLKSAEDVFVKDENIKIKKGITELSVCKGGSQLNDYEISYEGSGKIKCAKADNGKLRVDASGSGGGKVTIKSGNKKARFNIRTDGVIISLKFSNRMLDDGASVNIGGTGVFLSVCDNDKTIKNYTVKCEKDRNCTFTKTSDGRLEAQVKKKGKYKFTIAYKGEEATFYINAI